MSSINIIPSKNKETRLLVRDIPYGTFFVDANGHLCMKVNTGVKNQQTVVVTLGEAPDCDCSVNCMEFPFIERKKHEEVFEKVVQVDLQIK